MVGKKVWLLHLYSCLNTSDLEILYEKMGRSGLTLCESNVWADCFERKKSTDHKYKVVPINYPWESETFALWTLVAKNNKYYVLRSGGRNRSAEEPELFSDRVDAYLDDIMFLLAFPICIFLFFNQFHVLTDSILPIWLNWLFIGSTVAVYLGHVWAVFSYMLQRKRWANTQNKIREQKTFWLRFLITCLVNILQVVLIIIVFYGINI